MKHPQLLCTATYSVRSFSGVEESGVGARGDGRDARGVEPGNGKVCEIYGILGRNAGVVLSDRLGNYIETICTICQSFAKNLNARLERLGLGFFSGCDVFKSWWFLGILKIFSTNWFSCAFLKIFLEMLERSTIFFCNIWQFWWNVK